MKNLIAIATAALCASAATAQDVGQASAGLGISTYGINLEGAYRIDPSYGVRGVFISGPSAEYEETDDVGTIEGDAELGGLMIMGDFYPNQGDWRISGGLFFSQNEVSASGEIDGDAATASIKFENEVAPIVTTGYEWGFADGWSLTPEIGLIYTGGLAVEYTAENPADQATIDADPDVQDAIEDGEDIVLLPYLAFTVSYQF